ncbi:MAG: hypothetical protein LIP03_11275 [Bacteroidales bacterium]|nr:hypothetical protein [Bacteroidales bacterium]
MKHLYLILALLLSSLTVSAQYVTIKGQRGNITHTLSLAEGEKAQFSSTDNNPVAKYAGEYVTEAEMMLVTWDDSQGWVEVPDTNTTASVTIKVTSPDFYLLSWTISDLVYDGTTLPQIGCQYVDAMDVDFGYYELEGSSTFCSYANSSGGFCYGSQSLLFSSDGSLSYEIYLNHPKLPHTLLIRK